MILEKMVAMAGFYRAAGVARRAGSRGVESAHDGRADKPAAPPAGS